MFLYLTLGYPEAWGGAGRLVNSLRAHAGIYLASWPEGHGESKNPESRFVSGTQQWEGFEKMAKIHLADSDPQHHGWASRGAVRNGLRLRILLSYWYYKDTDLDQLFAKYFTEPYPDVFADSGAFSAMTQGVTITIPKYVEWIKRWKHLFSSYANLDVIKDAEATWRNQQIMEDMGTTPLPCFHVLEEWLWLEHYIERYPYIALGVAGMQARRDEIMAWITKCYQIAKGESVFHGFGLTSWNVMKSFPWYSVDSSSWGSGFRYGRVPLFDEKRGRFVQVGLGDVKSGVKHSALIRSLGFEPMDFIDRERNERAKICAISALSYMLAERWLRKRHGEVRIPGREDEPSGLKAHLVTGADGDGTGSSRGGNMSVAALAQAGVGPRLHLADTSNGINWSDADRGMKLFLVDTTDKPPNVALAIGELQGE